MAYELALDAPKIACLLLCNLRLVELHQRHRQQHQRSVRHTLRNRRSLFFLSQTAETRWADEDAGFQPVLKIVLFCEAWKKCACWKDDGAERGKDRREAWRGFMTVLCAMQWRERAEGVMLLSRLCCDDEDRIVIVIQQIEVRRCVAMRMVGSIG